MLTHIFTVIHINHTLQMYIHAYTHIFTVTHSFTYTFIYLAYLHIFTIQHILYTHHTHTRMCCTHICIVIHIHCTCMHTYIHILNQTYKLQMHVCIHSQIHILHMCIFLYMHEHYHTRTSHCQTDYNH